MYWTIPFLFWHVFLFQFVNATIVFLPFSFFFFQLILAQIPTSRMTINSLWTAYTIGSLTTSVREFQSLFMSQFSPLFPFILNPRSFGYRKQSGAAPPTDTDCITPAWLASILPVLHTKCNLNDSQVSLHQVSGFKKYCLRYHALSCCVWSYMQCES